MRILSIRSLLLQKQVDAQAVGPLIEYLRTEGVLQDPPIVAMIESDGSRYVVLDGADSVIALRKMKITYILGQVVEPRNGATPKALRVNYPLAELMNGISLTEKNNVLQQWLQAHIVDKSIWYYEEATILFDDWAFSEFMD